VTRQRQIVASGPRLPASPRVAPAGDVAPSNLKLIFS
jgi:hypothetical protein